MSKTIYLTGTPAKFIKNGYKPIFITGEELYDLGYSSPVYVGMVASRAITKEDSFNENHELTEDAVKNQENYVQSDMEALLDALHDRLAARFKNDPNWNLYASKWIPYFKKLHKTLIVCKSIEQAEKIYDYLNKKEINVVISHSGNDKSHYESKDTKEINKFIKNPEINVLIVVGRGILGFDMGNLVNIVDMTMSRNIDRICQLYNRVTRKHKDYPVKYFFKLASKNLSQMHMMQFYMQAALSLNFKHFIERWNGKNLNEMELTVHKLNKTRNSQSAYIQNTGKKKGPNYVPIDRLFFNAVNSMEFLKELNHRWKDGSKEYAGGVIDKITFMEIKNKFFGSPIQWTDEMLLSDALKYTKRGEWKKNSSAYQVARARQFVFLQCIKHMDIPPLPWTKERCQEEANKFTKRGDFFKNSKTAYVTSRKRGWFDEICQHMDIPPLPWTKERCQEEALKFITRNDFGKKSEKKSAYVAARKNGWLDEICSHMDKSSTGKIKIVNNQTSEIFESIQAAARKYGQSTSNLSKHLKGKLNSFANFTWSYVKK